MQSYSVLGLAEVKLTFFVVTLMLVCGLGPE